MWNNNNDCNKNMRVESKNKKKEQTWWDANIKKLFCLVKDSKVVLLNLLLNVEKDIYIVPIIMQVRMSSSNQAN